METNQNRFVYLDNIRNFLVYNVVLLHVIAMFAYPLSFWWAVIDKEGSSRFYETGSDVHEHLFDALPVIYCRAFHLSIIEKRHSP